MICSEVRGHLPAYTYGDLEDAERQAVQTHLADCTACRQERDGLRQVRELLDVVPAPQVQLDPLQIQQEAMARQEKRLRRWRRAAWAALGSLAAALLFLVLPALELRWEGHQFVLRWGAPPPAPMPVPAPTAATAFSEALVKLQRMQDDLHMLATLINSQAEETDRRDRHQVAELTALRTQLAALQLWVRTQIVENERNLTAVYHLSRKGENR